MTAEQAKLMRTANRLYERYAKPLEAEHAGKYVAVSPKGQLIIGDTMLDVAQRATEAFGRGNFVFKIGPRAVGKWR
jgi:hypothetical protein